MPTFSSASLKHLSTLHPDLQHLLTVAINYVDFTIICGHRSKADQDKAYAKGRSKVRWPNSKHNHLPSLAADVMLYFKTPPHIRWDDTQSQLLFIGFLKGLATGLGIDLRVGADWNGDFDTTNQSFTDLPHIELKGE